MPPMKPLVICSLAVASVLAISSEARAQTFATGEKANAQLETLTKKIDEQNMKIDALSQQLLKLEQQIASARPGVIVGEPPTPPAAPAPAAATTGSGTSPTASATGSGNEHVVAKGETLISIAKAHKVGVDELQKFNHIEDARKLQAGQTIMIPVPGASPSASPTAAP